MKDGHLRQRHTRACPRGKDGQFLEHRCRGSWGYTIDIGRSRDGQRQQISKDGFPTRAAARTALREIQQQLAIGIDLSQQPMAFYLEAWLAGKRAIRPSTVRIYRDHLDHHLIPLLGHIGLQSLRAEHVDKFIDQVARRPGKRPLSSATVCRVYATLRTALNAAVRRRLIPYNPALQVELPPEIRQDVVVWSPAEVGQFLDASRSDRLYALFHLVTMTGLRRGEAVGLRMVDLDLNRRWIRVTQQVVESGADIHIGPPKTKSGARTVPLDATSLEVVRAHLAQRDAERLAWGEAWTDTGLIFGREDGTMLAPEQVTRRFVLLVRRAGLPMIKFHGLRHTSASLALAAGVPMKVVSERLGHSTTGITADLYAHVSPALARDAADAIAGMIAAAQAVDRARPEQDRDHEDWGR